jgi:predicted SprT family Zn-dependent metalloprotease
MGNGFDTDRDFGNDNSPDIGNGAGSNHESDYGGALATDKGIDLNTGHYTYADYLESGEVRNPFEVHNETYTNEYTDGFTNEDIRNSLHGHTGEDLNKFSKENIDNVLDNFQESSWNDLSLEDQKQSMRDLADYVVAETGNKNPPEIVFRDDMEDGSYGGYNPESNTMEVNANMLDDSAEAADTIAHELWHAHQHQCALDPTSEKGHEYQEGFDNYISPEYDFEGYQNQMVEAEAREYAQGFKDRLAGMQGGVA